MSFDAHKNFAYSSIVVPPTGTTGTSLTVTSGHGAKFPATPFNVVTWPLAVLPSSTNAEILRVTAVVGDAFTVTREQEGTTAKTLEAGYQIAASITSKMITDAEEAITALQADLASVDSELRAFSVALSIALS